MYKRDSQSVRFIGPDPRLRGGEGHSPVHIATCFPLEEAVVTVPGIHAMQRMAFLEQLNEERRGKGLPLLSAEEENQLWHRAVDLILEGDNVFIRSNPERMDMALRADELLQRAWKKRDIRFLNLFNKKVREAVKRRGECWRMAPMPQTSDEMKARIASLRIGIGGKEIYYYNPTTGTRYLTVEELSKLELLDDEALLAHLSEIQKHANSKNMHGYPEVEFFLASDSFKLKFIGQDFIGKSPEAIRGIHAELVEQMRQNVSSSLREDNLENDEWRLRMFNSLVLRPDDGISENIMSEEVMLGLSPEFFLRIEWLPGGRMENGKLIPDAVLEEDYPRSLAEPGGESVSQSAHTRDFIINFMREYGELEYINIGRVVESLSKRKSTRKQERREVYLIEFKRKGDERESVQVIRMQKLGVREHLQSGKSFYEAVVESHQYTENILDRWLGCRQLGIRLPARLTVDTVKEPYQGDCRVYEGQLVSATYYKRDYVRGIATDKIPDSRFENLEYALRYADLLGEAAGSNIVVGRCVKRKEGLPRVLFDDGDEIIIEDSQGLPLELVVTDHTGSFVDYQHPLETFAEAYARPVRRRLEAVSSRDEFAERYLDAFQRRLLQLQAEYRRNPTAFHLIFDQRQSQKEGGFIDRWRKVLRRLEMSNAKEVTEAIRQIIYRQAVPPPHILTMVGTS